MSPRSLFCLSRLGGYWGENCKYEYRQRSNSLTYMVNQKRILLSLIQGQEGRAWALDKNGWKVNGEISVCSWDYILCDSYGTVVTGISMYEADFIGSLPSELGQLTTLEKISMRRNLIFGSLPREIGKLPHLERIFLESNRITGSIPNFDSPKLKTLELANNLLSGSLDNNFLRSNFDLVELDLAHNKIQGILPISIENCKRLQILSLSENEFSGTIHDFFGRKRSFKYLYLNGNSLMGTIPSTFSDQSSSVKKLWLQNNLLTGTVPEELGEMPELSDFYIDGNKFTGAVPPSLCRGELNKDFFKDVPQSDGRDYCESVACPPGKVSLEGVFPCQQCVDSFYNPYLGRVNECFDLEEMDILNIFYEATGGYQWQNVRWDVQGDSYCNLDGVTCGNHGNIISINLKGQGLRGIIPEEIGFLQYLEYLDLSDNYLHGPLPSDLRWAPLRYLDVSGNKLKGIIPKTICSKESINGNGNDGIFDCDFVQCSPGFYSKTGRRTEYHECLACPNGRGTPFIGSTKCVSLFAHLHPDYVSEMSALFQFFGIVFVLCFLGIVCKSVYNIQKDDEHRALLKVSGEKNQKLSDTVLLM